MKNIKKIELDCLNVLAPLCNFCFVHPIFRFCFLVTFGDKNTKILCNLCLHFARQDGQDGKNRKENHATKVTKIPITKRRKYGMNETFVSRTSGFCRKYANLKKHQFSY